MPANVGVNPAIQQLNDIQTQLANQGLSVDQIDAWIRSQGIESILSDNRLVAQYFTTAARALQSLTQPNYDDRIYSLSNEVPPPNNYQPYFSSDRDTSGGVPGVDYFPEQNLFDPQWLVQNGYFTPTMASAYQNLMTHGYFSGGQSAATGSPAYTGGTTPTGTKGMSIGTPGTKALELPTAPPPSGGTGGSYPGQTASGPTGAPATFTQADWDYVNSLEEGPSKQWLGQLLGDAEMERGVVWGITQSLQSDREASQKINQIIEGLDPTNPEDAHRIMTLTNERGLLQDSIREKMDKLSQAQRYFDERVSLVKNFIEADNRTREAIIRNMRQG